MNAFTANNGSEPRYKLVIKQPKFYIHSHKKVIVCELQCCLPDLPFKHKVDNKYFSDALAYGVFKVKASAKCMPEDKYNEETGVKIAESKAMVKAYDKARRILEDYKEVIDAEWNKANNSVDFFATTLGRECMHLESLTR